MTQQRNDGLEADGLDATSELSAEEVEVTEIRAEIEETRLEMGGTLNELGERLDPGHLVDQAKESVREATIGRVEETAEGVATMVMETIKRNPIPAAMAGAGLALLWMNKSSGTGNGNGHTSRSRSMPMYGDDMYGRAGRDVGGRAAGMASDVGRNVAGAAESVGETIGEAGQQVGQTVGQGVQEAGWRLERFMDSSPLALGAIAVGAGAVVGAIVPETSQERELLGDASRAVGETVRDTVSQATDEAEESLERAAQPSA